MKRLLSIVTLVFALVALSGPSLSMGMGLYGVPHGQVTASEDGTALVWTCKELGGKRAVSCHPDLGVLNGAIASSLPGPAGRRLVNTVPRTQGLSPSAELPPPRLG